MAKGQYQNWITEEGLTLLEGWARLGLVDEQIAHNMGISTSTLYDWKNKYPEISKALKKGKEVVNFEVENALYKSALSGNVTAQIYWLNNRMPKRWRNKQESENGAESSIEDDPITKSIKETFHVIK